MRDQNAWLSGYLRHHAPDALVMGIVGDHQAPALASGAGEPWDVPVHVVSSDPALLHRLMARGFVPGLRPAPQALGPMTLLTHVLADVFDAPPAHTPGEAAQSAMPTLEAPTSGSGT